MARFGRPPSDRPHPRMKTSLNLFALIGAWAWAPLGAFGADAPGNGLDLNLGNLYRVSPAQSRSISAENPSGEPGRGGMATTGTGQNASRDLGQGWKVSPSVGIPAHATVRLAEMEGSGCIQQIWMTVHGNWRLAILRFFWDGETEPSVEVPVGDFFASGWAYQERCPLFSSLAVCVNPRSGFNCYWPMPFRKQARVTLQNLDDKPISVFYQVNYTLTQVPDDAGYFHAQFRRENPLKTKGIYTIVDGIRGAGQYVGTYLAWGVHNNRWWGEGEIKFFLDGDGAFPSICGTGTEDYFCGSGNFETAGPEGKKRYTEFATAYSGMPQVIRPDGLYDAQQRFSLYRWHIADPVRFQKALKVTIQALGWQSGGRYLPLRDDIASVAFWYQTEPHAPFPPLPDKDYLDF